MKIRIAAFVEFMRTTLFHSNRILEISKNGQVQPGDV